MSVTLERLIEMPRCLVRVILRPVMRVVGHSKISAVLITLVGSSVPFVGSVSAIASTVRFPFQVQIISLKARPPW